MVKRKGGNSRGSERLELKSGCLGPVRAPCTIEVKPFTLFIGRQGTGKSLIAQVLYFFRGLPRLVQFDSASREDGPPVADDPRDVVRRLVDGLRSARRRFAALTKPNLSVYWSGNLAIGGDSKAVEKLSFNAQFATRQVQPGKRLTDLVKAARTARRNRPWTAVFVPTERLLCTLALGPSSLDFLRTPLILKVFAHFLEIATDIHEDWPDGMPDTDEGRWVRERLRLALAGEARRRGDTWRWSFADGGDLREMDLDMASSGQRANWPLMLIAEVLFSLRARGEIADGFTLYVEEPEIHLHPDAERAMVHVLAYLVLRGFRVVLTTHSLTVLYALNNLILADGLAKGVCEDEVPSEIRLPSRHVAAYHLTPEGSVEPLIDGDAGLISEGVLGRTADLMAGQMNRLYAARAGKI